MMGEIDETAADRLAGKGQPVPRAIGRFRQREAWVGFGLGLFGTNCRMLKISKLRCIF